MKFRVTWLVLAAALTLYTCPVHAQPKKLRPLRIALPSHTIAGTHFYVGKSLGIYEHYGFDAQLLVLEPRAALAALTTGDLDFYTATGTSTRSAFARCAGTCPDGRFESAGSCAGCFQGNH